MHFGKVQYDFTLKEGTSVGFQNPLCDIFILFFWSETVETSMPASLPVLALPHKVGSPLNYLAREKEKAK